MQMMQEILWKLKFILILLQIQLFIVFNTSYLTSCPLHLHLLVISWLMSSPPTMFSCRIHKQTMTGSILGFKAVKSFVPNHFESDPGVNSFVLLSGLKAHNKSHFHYCTITRSGPDPHSREQRAAATGWPGLQRHHGGLEPAGWGSSAGGWRSATGSSAAGRLQTEKSIGHQPRRRPGGASPAPCLAHSEPSAGARDDAKSPFWTRTPKYLLLTAR